MFVESPGLFQILGVLLPVAVVAAVVFVTYWLIHTVRMNKEIGNKAGNRYVLLTVVCLLLAGAAWLFNLGLVHVLLSWCGLPLFYGAFFCFANCKAAARAADIDRVKKYIRWSCVTYLIAYVCFPDVGFEGEMYVLFSLIRSDTVSTVALCLSLAAFVANIILSILEIIMASKWKKPIPPQTDEAAKE